MHHVSIIHWSGWFNVIAVVHAVNKQATDTHNNIPYAHTLYKVTFHQARIIINITCSKGTGECTQKAQLGEV